MQEITKWSEGNLQPKKVVTFRKIAHMEAVKGLTNLQLELLKIFSVPLKEDQLKDIKALLSRYFAEKASEEMDKLWEENKWSDETMREWAQEHLRTKSKK